MRAAFKDDEFTIPDIVIDDEPSDGIPGGLTLGQLDPLPPEADETPSAAERPLLDAQDDVRQAEALGSGDLDNAASPEDVSPSGGSSPADAPAADAPRGLYTERSGLGWEAYLPDRLEAELSRSASLEQDCSLILFHLDGADQASDAYAALARAIPSFFTFRDLAFERGQDGFAMILPGIDLNRALRMAEDFLKKLTLDLTGAIPKPGPELLPLYMGVSSRSGRLVKAERLLDESARALDKARTEGDSRIVGFRANPDRYRDFIAGKF
jgi:GGDEF domain-containing protein